MLTGCATAGIAAFAGPRDGARRQQKDPVYRVWVDSQRFAAEDVLRDVLGRAP